MGRQQSLEGTSLPWAQWIPFFQHIFPFTLDQTGIDVLNAPRMEVGLVPVSAEDVWRAPLYLYFTAPPLILATADLAPSFRVVGPGLWEPPAIGPGWLEDLEDPLVLIAVSSEFQRDGVLVDTVLETLRTGDVSVVITTAAHDPHRFQAPPRMRIARWLPHRPLVRRAACVVCHGGMGITQKALAGGIPVCIVPFGRDQFEVADQVTRTGAGTSVAPDELTPSLRTAIFQAISRRDAAQRVAAEFTGTGGAAAAADALESLLRSPRDPGASLSAAAGIAEP